MVEQSINAAAIAMLANATAIYQGGTPFGVIFDRAPQESLDLIGGYAPTCGLEVASAPGIEQDSVLHIDGVAYSVAGPVEPDSSGWATLQLRAVSGGAHG